MKIVGVVLVFLCACQSVTDGAKESFSSEKTCPLARVEARERPELKPSQFDKSDPPPDVAADPGRLQMWRDEHKATADKDDMLGQIVEVRGCDKHVFYNCVHPTSSSNGARWMCMTQTNVPEGISHW